MDATYFSAMAIGLGNVFSWPNILIPLIGTAIVMVPSFLPGIGGLGIATFLLILTISWDPVSVLLLFGAVTGGATFMGSITAILFNIPGSAPSAAALLDGFPLAQKGFARTAIACAATASAVGSLFGVIVLILLIPAIRPLLLEFGPAERLLIGIWGFTTIIGIPGHSPFKAAAMCSLGFLAAMVGSDVRTGDARWIFGVDALYEGFGIIAVLIGFFTISEILGWDKAALTHNGTMHSAKGDSVLNGVKAVFRNMGLTIRSSGIGTLVGMMPGVGGTVASFIAYGQAANSSRGSGDTFGRGDIRGLIAPEAAVDAKDGGSLLPVVAFGLPGSEAGVVVHSDVRRGGHVVEPLGRLHVEPEGAHSPDRAAVDPHEVRADAEVRRDLVDGAGADRVLREAGRDERAARQGHEAVPARGRERDAHAAR
jgi:TctA family transporter